MSENLILTKFKNCTESASKKHNPAKPPEDNYQEAQWQFGDNIVIPQIDLYTIAWEAEFGGHLSDISLIYTDPNAIDFDGRHTQEPDAVIVFRFYFHVSSDGQNRETRPISDPSVPQISKSKSIGQNRDMETTTDLAQNDKSEQIFKPSTDTENAYELILPPSRQSDDPSTLEINDPTTEKTSQNVPCHSRGGN